VSFNFHEVILDGSSTITGYTGYSNQAFFTSVSDTDGNIIVSPADSKIADTFPAAVHAMAASLESDGYSYTYDPTIPK